MGPRARGAWPSVVRYRADLQEQHMLCKICKSTRGNVLDGQQVHTLNLRQMMIVNVKAMSRSSADATPCSNQNSKKVPACRGTAANIGEG